MHLATMKPISGSLSHHTSEQSATRQRLPVLEHSQRTLDARDNGRCQTDFCHLLSVQSINSNSFLYLLFLIILSPASHI